MNSLRVIAWGLVLAAAPLLAAGACKPVVGSFEATLVPPGQGHCPAIDVPPGRGGFASLITFEGPTSGQIKLRGDFNAAAGTTSGDYIGELCQP